MMRHSSFGFCAKGLVLLSFLLASTAQAQVVPTEELCLPALKDRGSLASAEALRMRVWPARYSSLTKTYVRQGTQPVCVLEGASLRDHVINQKSLSLTGCSELPSTGLFGLEIVDPRFESKNLVFFERDQLLLMVSNEAHESLVPIRDGKMAGEGSVYFLRSDLRGQGTNGECRPVDRMTVVFPAVMKKAPTASKIAKAKAAQTKRASAKIAQVSAKKAAAKAASKKVAAKAAALKASKAKALANKKTDQRGVASKKSPAKAVKTMKKPSSRSRREIAANHSKSQKWERPRLAALERFRKERTELFDDELPEEDDGLAITLRRK